MQNVDSLIHARWVVPVQPDNVVLEEHSIAVHDGRILAVLPTAKARSAYRGDIEHHCSEHVLIPGLVNAHTHAAMSLLRGLADDVPLMDWLTKHIWPTEQRWASEEFVADGTRLAIAEMLRGGITCFNDMYFFPDATARVASAAGMRACVGLIVLDFPSPWAGASEEYLEKGLHVHDQFSDNPLVTSAFAPHAPYSVSDSALERVRILADELEIPVHMHVHESRAEIQESLDKTGRRPLERLQELDLVSPALVGVHMTQIDDGDMEILAGGGASIVHCPESNMKLANGICPVTALLAKGINVALGTDGAASNNDLDMFGEMHTAALLAKAHSNDPTAVPAHTALRMATLNGAAALGLGDQTGSLEAGKWADITAVNMNALETQPVYHVDSQLAYSCNRSNVTDVWVAGEHVLKDRELTTLDPAEILEGATLWRDRILGGASRTASAEP